MTNYDNDSKQYGSYAGDFRALGHSPDEVKENVKRKVATGVAAVAGAVEGFVDEMKETDLTNTTEEAIKQAGRATRVVARTTRNEVKRARDAITGQDGGIGLGRGEAGAWDGGRSGGSSGSGSGGSNGSDEDGASNVSGYGPSSGSQGSTGSGGSSGGI